MKRKVLFCIENYGHGGIGKALESLISQIDQDRYDIGVFAVNREDGPYKAVFERYAKYTADRLLQAYCTNFRKHTGLTKYALLGIKFLRKVLARFNFDPFEIRLNKWKKRIQEDRYDTVIAFAEGYITEFVSRIEGHKLAWIHIDYQRYLSYVNNKNEHDIYNKIDNIVIPSNFSAKTFAQIFHDLKNRIIVSPNLLDIQNVTTLSNETGNLDPRFKKEGFTLISVGRISYEKRFFEIPVIASKLRGKGLTFKWYIIGGGSDAETQVLTDAIKKEDIQSNVIPLGKKDNPYPYIKLSDLLISTSLSETFSYVVFEAKTLGVPVVCADFGTAPEIINENEGVICSLESMPENIFTILTNKSRLHDLKKNLEHYSYNNLNILENLYEIL